MAEQSSAGYVEWLPELFPPQGEWRESNFFALPDSNRIIELSEGEIRMSPPPTPQHQPVVKRLFRAVAHHVRHTGFGETFFAPVALRLWDSKIRKPDVLVLKQDQLQQIGDQSINAPVAWVAEVISPDSVEVGTQEKIVDYAAARIPEYWLIDPVAETIEIYTLIGTEYALAETLQSGDMASSRQLEGFETEVNRIFHD